MTRVISVLVLILACAIATADERRRVSAEIDAGLTDYGGSVGGDLRLSVAHDDRWVRVGGLVRVSSYFDVTASRIPYVDLETGPMIEFHAGRRVRLGGALMVGAFYFPSVDEGISYYHWYPELKVASWISVDAWQGRRGNAVVVSLLLDGGLVFGNQIAPAFPAGSLEVGYRF